MDRRIRNSLVVVAVLIIAYPAAAWLIGLATRHEWQKREQVLLEDSPDLELIKQDYDRGVYSSTEELTYRLRGPLLQNLRALGVGTDLSDLRITVHNTIHHGPLPRMRAFAPATVDSEIVSPPAWHARLTAHTRLNWLGGSTTEMHSAAFEHNTSGGTTIMWRGLDGISAVGRDFNSYSADFTAAGFSVKSAAASFNVGKVRVRADRHSVGEYVDIDAKVTADELRVADFSASRLGYEIHVAHVHGPSLAALTRSLQTAQAREVSKTDGIEILLRDPVFEIPHIQLTMPEGELAIALQVNLHGLTRAELNGPPALVATMFAKHVQAAADLRIDTALLDKLLDSTGKGDRLAAPLQGLQQQGYLELHGKALTTHLTYREGRLEVNGRSFPAVGPMPQPPGP